MFWARPVSRYGKSFFEKELIPRFETEEQETEYWDTHSPLDLAVEPKAQRVRVGVTKDRPITIHLDRESRSKLEKLAGEQGLGPSTFARLILTAVIERRENGLILTMFYGRYVSGVTQRRI